MRLCVIRLFASITVLSVAAVGVAQPYFVSPDGSDANPGTQERPFATLQRAQSAVRQKRGDVVLRGGTYYLVAPLVFTSADSGTANAPVVWRSNPGETPVISGGVRLDALDWQPFRDGIFQAQVPVELRTEEIFINGERQILARYPNFDPTAQYFGGCAADAIAPERATHWANPSGGYYHAMHPALWGDFTWRITGKVVTGEPTLEGGWQNNRGAAAHETIRFVENLFEELDAPGEWFLDAKTHTLYFYPPAGLDLKTAVVEATRLRTLVEFRGDEAHPVKWVTLRGLTFRHAARTVMDNREPLLRSDWTIYRGGAVFFNGAEDCAIEGSFIDQVGGNAVFVNNYNRRVAIRGTHITQAGASGVCFVGDPQAARSPLFNYYHTQDLERIDRTPGPQTHNYPADCLVEDCLIERTGRVEKQTAGVQIELSRRITVRHCSIYDVPRAGINISSGCWGGHVIEHCDIFDTVKETGDHGSFNSWGRDRFWRPNIDEVNAWVAQAPDLPLLDVIEPIVLANNRWRCDHGWDIDLDDGSSNYVIRNNLCLRGGIKLREGFRRIVENNVLVDGGFDPHVWYQDSGDSFRRNIVWTAYRPAHMPPAPWGEEMNFNFVHAGPSTAVEPATRLQAQSGRDEHSLVGDAQFVDAERGDYRVKEGSPALALGFVNFPMDQFGVTSPKLRALARTPLLPDLSATPSEMERREPAPATWFDARVRNILDRGEMSAFGLAGVTGVLVLEVPDDSPLSVAGLREGDVILSINGSASPDTTTLMDHTRALNADTSIDILISRNQRQQIVRFAPQVRTGARDSAEPRSRDQVADRRFTALAGQDRQRPARRWRKAEVRPRNRRAARFAAEGLRRYDRARAEDPLLSPATGRIRAVGNPPSRRGDIRPRAHDWKDDRRVIRRPDGVPARNLTVVINIHWDEGGFEKNTTGTVNPTINSMMHADWPQVANAFKEYDSRLLFAAANEPNCTTPEPWNILVSYYNTFINAVRCTGGNNATRWLVIQGPDTDAVIGEVVIGEFQAMKRHGLPDLTARGAEVRPKTWLVRLRQAAAPRPLFMGQEFCRSHSANTR